MCSSVFFKHKYLYIIDTRHTHMCSSVFFKHKYLMMPSLTPADALIRASDNLTTALAGVIPPPSMTTNTIVQLINIFKMQAEKKKDKATLQRELRENAQAERVLNDTVAGPTSPRTTTTTTYPPLKIEEYPEMDVGTLHQLSIQKTTPIHHDRQPTHVTTNYFT
jgi:hypothetical protein